jgi:hypothetical protein
MLKVLPLHVGLDLFPVVKRNILEMQTPEQEDPDLMILS